MSDTPPDRLSSNPRSPYFDQSLLERGIGIRFKGQQRHDVEEYCLSEGWIRVALGKKVDRHGQPLTLKLSGEVEAWFERPGADAAIEEAPEA
ncbi:MAG: glutathione peroxidase [Sphingomonas sp. 28-66-16]|nr:MAG: glutathione peroxidase [Sphingomonas sp. 28-66-16]